MICTRLRFSQQTSKKIYSPLINVNSLNPNNVTPYRYTILVIKTLLGVRNRSMTEHNHFEILMIGTVTSYSSMHKEDIIWLILLRYALSFLFVRAICIGGHGNRMYSQKEDTSKRRLCETKTLKCMFWWEVDDELHPCIRCFIYTVETTNSLKTEISLWCYIDVHNTDLCCKLCPGFAPTPKCTMFSVKLCHSLMRHGIFGYDWLTTPGISCISLPC